LVDGAAGSSPIASTICGHDDGAKAPVRSEDDTFQEGMALLPQVADIEAEQNAVHHGDAEDRYEPHPGGDAKERPGNYERKDAAEAGDWNLRHDDEGIDQRQRRAVENSG
jgi:hypothetical protein